MNNLRLTYRGCDGEPHEIECNVQQAIWYIAGRYMGGSITATDYSIVVQALDAGDIKTANRVTSKYNILITPLVELSQLNEALESLKDGLCGVVRAPRNPPQGRKLSEQETTAGRHRGMTVAGDLTAADLGAWIIDPRSDTIARLVGIQHTSIAADKTTTIRLELGGYAITRNLSPATPIEKCPPDAQNRAPDASKPQQAPAHRCFAHSDLSREPK